MEKRPIREQGSMQKSQKIIKFKLLNLQTQQKILTAESTRLHITRE